MPIFELFYGWAITIYLNDHNPAHFHAKKAETSVRVFLEDGSLEVERGKLSPADRRKLQEYAKRNKTRIEEFWNELH